MALSKTKLASRERAAKKTLERKLGKGAYRLRSFRESGDGLFAFDLEHLGFGGVTFDAMAAVSEAFSTKGINVSAWYDEGGCPTCGGTTEYTLEVTGARVG